MVQVLAGWFLYTYFVQTFLIISLQRWLKCLTSDAYLIGLILKNDLLFQNQSTEHTHIDFVLTLKANQINVSHTVLLHWASSCVPDSWHILQSILLKKVVTFNFLRCLARMLWFLFVTWHIYIRTGTKAFKTKDRLWLRHTLYGNSWKSQ